jgi:putative ABC transport system permease protein
MSILERVRELGTLLAIGTGRGQLAALVLWEALWLGLLGGLAGSGLGFVAIVGLNALRIEMPPPPGATSPIDLRLAVVPEAFVGTIVLMLVVLVLAAVVPIVRTLRLRIVEALGHV